MIYIGTKTLSQIIQDKSLSGTGTLFKAETSIEIVEIKEHN